MSAGEPSQKVPGLRPELLRGTMAVYDVRYGKELGACSYERLRRIYVPAGDIVDPGLWGGQGFFVKEWETRTETARIVVPGFCVNSAGWIRNNHFGITEYFRPVLFGFRDSEDEPDRVETTPGDNVLLDPSGAVALDAGRWIVKGKFYFSILAGGKGTHWSPVSFVFDEARKLYTEVAIENAFVDGDIRFYRDREGTPLEFRLAAVEPFPPADLVSRIAKAIQAGTGYLAGHREDVLKAPWTSSYPVGVRALVAWGILRGGGDLSAARGLLEEAIKLRLETTYDTAFLVLALDALIARLRLDPIVEPSGKTAVAGPLDSERKIADAMKKAVAALISLRAQGIGLWGYKAAIPSCADPGKCLFTYSDGLQGFRKGQAIADTSNTFWALDAMKAASERGIKVPKSIWSEAVRGLERWGTYLKSKYQPPHLAPDNPVPGKSYTAPQRLALERREPDLTLRFTRRLRLPGSPGPPKPGSERPEETKVRPKTFNTWFYSYSSYPGAEKGYPFSPSGLSAVDHTSVYPSHIAGLGGLVLAYGGVRASPLSQPTVEGGLLWARCSFRRVLGSCDIPPGEDFFSKDPNYGPKCSTAAPGNFGYNFLLLERFLDYLGIEELGHHPWFPLLALHALDFQEAEGGWCAWRGDKLVPTALFVLALARSRDSDASLDLPLYSLGPVTTGPAAEGGEDRRLYIPADGGKHFFGPEVVASLRATGAAGRIALARNALEAAGEDLGSQYVPLLVAVYLEGPSASKSFAREALAKITGNEKGGPERWMAWHRAKKTALEGAGKEGAGKGKD